MRNRTVAIGASVIALLVALGLTQSWLDRAAAQSKANMQAPRFEVDPLWPKPLPNHWILGSTIGVWVDSDDHVWIIHRSSATLGNNEKTLETKQRSEEHTSELQSRRHLVCRLLLEKKKKQKQITKQKKKTIQNKTPTKSVNQINKINCL